MQPAYYLYNTDKCTALAEYIKDLDWNSLHSWLLCLFRGDHGKLWRRLAGTSTLCSDHTEELWPWKEKYGAEDSGGGQIYLLTFGGVCWYIQSSITHLIFISTVHLCNHMFRGRSHISFISTSLPGKSIDPEHLYHHAASNIIASIIFGSRFNYQDEYFQTLITNLEKLTKIAIGQWAMVNTITSLDTVYLHWMQRQPCC